MKFETIQYPTENHTECSWRFDPAAYNTLHVVHMAGHIFKTFSKNKWFNIYFRILEGLRMFHGTGRVMNKWRFLDSVIENDRLASPFYIFF